MLKRIIGSALFISVILIYFQNCSTKTPPLYLSSTSSESAAGLPLPLDHPPTPTADLTTQKVLIVNRDYVKTLLLEIFTGNQGPSENLETLVEAWVTNRGSQFGLGCDTLSSYSGRDCGGDSTASNSPQFVDHNTVRESYHLQLCRQILASDIAVNNVLEKIKPNLPVPNKDAVISLYNLFYRGDDPNENIINSLLDLDHSLAQSRESTIERWRGLILVVCESPNWQIL